jgi:hypothetical protein
MDGLVMPRGKLHLGRWLFSAAGAAALLFAAAAVAMWVRSHAACDSAYVELGRVNVTIVTARDGCLFHWIGGRAERRPLFLRHTSNPPADLLNWLGNWRFWTQSNPHRLLGVITWGRASYGGNGWGMSILAPYWLLACVAAVAGIGLLTMSRHLHRRSRRRAGQCVRCGYDLRATPDRCPECGVVPDTELADH